MTPLTLFIFFIFVATWNNPHGSSVILDNKIDLLLSVLDVLVEYRYCEYLSQLGFLYQHLASFSLIIF